MNPKAFKSSLMAALAILTAHCKTANSSSGLRDQGDVSDGMQVQAGDMAKRALWAVRMGMELTDGDGGAAIASVEPARFAAVIGLSQGDVISALNGKAVTGAADFESKAKAFTGYGPDAAGWSGNWTFKVRRGGREIDVQPPKGYDCDPYILVGCGPLNASTD